MKTLRIIILFNLAILFGFVKPALSKDISADQLARETLLPDSNRESWFSSFVSDFQGREDLGRPLFLELANQSDIGSQWSAFWGLAVFGQKGDQKIFEKLFSQLTTNSKAKKTNLNSAPYFKLLYFARAKDDHSSQEQLALWAKKEPDDVAASILCWSHSKWGFDALVERVKCINLPDAARYGAWQFLIENKDERAIGLLEGEKFYEVGEKQELPLKGYLQQLFWDERFLTMTNEMCIAYLKNEKSIFSKFRPRDKIVGDVDWKKLLAEKPPQ